MTTTYDAAGQQSVMNDSTGRTTFTYDAAGQIKTLVNPEGDHTTWTYDATGRQTDKVLANGVGTTTIYNAAGQITAVEHNKSSGAKISSFAYTYNDAGNRTSVVDADGTRTTWTYDAASQLTREQRSASPSLNTLTLSEWEALTLTQWEEMTLGANYDTTFTYDAVGNRLKRTSTGTTTTFTYDDANQLKTSIDSTGTTTYTFDNVGNQLTTEQPTGALTTNTWDDENRLTQVDLPTGTDNQYAYNGDGKRIQIIDSSGTRKLIWDAEDVLLETSSGGTTQVVYSLQPAFYGNLVSQRRASTTSYYLFDALGSTSNLSDNNENIVDSYIYDAYGSILSSNNLTTNPFRFVGKLGYYLDEDILDYYVRARHYEPNLSRFISRDPIRFNSGDINDYTYVSNSPTNMIDPSGLVKTIWGPDVALISWIELTPGAPALLNLSANPVPPLWFRGVLFDRDKPNVVDSQTLGSFKARKEFRNIQESQLRICCKDGKIFAYSRSISNTTGFTPVRTSPTNTLHFSKGRMGPSYIRDNNPKGKTCYQLITLRRFRLGMLANAAGAVATFHLAPYAWSLINYRLCCDGTAKIRFGGSFVPSHSLYIYGKKAAEHSMRTQPAPLFRLNQFITAGDRAHAPGTRNFNF